MPRCCRLLVTFMVGLVLSLAFPLAGVPAASAQDTGQRFNFFGRGFADDNWDGNRRSRQRAKQQQRPQQQQRRTIFTPFGFGQPQAYGQGGWIQNQNRGWRRQERQAGTLWGSDESQRVRQRPRRLWWFETPQV